MMGNIEYLSFTEIDPVDLLEVLNDDALRVHLIDHPQFNPKNILTWVEEKKRIDALQGCQVRVVIIDKVVAGWCGIQPDDDGFEIALVISKRFWGCGIPIFKTLMLWAEELGHKEVLFHLLDTRREYKALTKMATKVHHSQLLGRDFTTYHLAVGQEKR